MSLVRQILSIVTTISCVALVPIASQAQSINVQGDCNVVAPSQEASGNIKYEISCNNISASAGDQIERILELIEKSSKETASADLANTLSQLARNSEDALAEIRRARSPMVSLSRRDFPVCNDCTTFIDFVNDGGDVQHVEEFLLREVVHVHMEEWADTETECPFGAIPFNTTRWITMDYDKGGYNVSGATRITSGERLASVEFSQRYRGHRAFERAVLENYNDQRVATGKGAKIDLELLDDCTDFVFEIGLKFALRSYGGALYEQFFAFEYSWEEGQPYLADRVFDAGPDGFSRLIEDYDRAKASRTNPDGKSGTVNWGAIAERMLAASDR